MTQIPGNTLQSLQGQEIGHSDVTNSTGQKRSFSMLQESCSFLDSQRLTRLFSETVQTASEGFSKSEERRILQVIQVFMPVSSTLQSLNAGHALLYWYKTVQETMGDSYFFLTSNSKSFESYKHLGLQGVICLLQWIVELGDEGDTRPLLVSFYKQELSLGRLLEQLEQKKWEIEAIRYPEKNINEVLHEFSGLGGQLAFPLSQQELKHIAEQFAEIEKLCAKFKKCTIFELVDEVKAIRSKESMSEQDRLALCAIARESIRLKFKIYPYNTQILAFLGIINHPEHYKGRIAQVRTGEGKSTVITLLAFYNACLGHTVDIITSSRYLAERDCKKYVEFYQLFDIPISHICTDEPSRDNFKGRIVFGTNSDFEFALLKDSLWQKRLRTMQTDASVEITRPFHVAIVDEVDNLFIDTALQSSRIAMSTEGVYGWVYTPILDFVKTHTLSLITSQNSASLLRTMLMQWNIGARGEQVAAIEDAQLERWFQSALTALVSYREGYEYEVMPTTDTVAKQEIVLVDRKNTGRKMHGMRAAGGVHEFLEAKHHLAVRAESVVSAALSHPVYFAEYQSIYGLSGTLGSDIERKEVEKVYAVDTFDVPSHRTNQRTVLDPILCRTEDEYYLNMLQDIEGVLRQARPTLVLFESIKESVDFAAFLRKRGLQYQILNERQAEEEYFIIAKAGAPKMITIATNTAGRGTDIILHPKSAKRGGLHVIFSFYPENDRVEDQGFGRGARQGQPGTCRMILLSPEETFQELSRKRMLRTQEISEQRMKRISIERINHRYLKDFLSLLRNWHDVLDTGFLKHVQAELGAILKSAPQCTQVVGVEGAELKLSQEFLRLVEHRDEEGHCVEQFLQAVLHALGEKIQRSWAENFYSKLNGVYSNSTSKDIQERVALYEEKIACAHAVASAGWQGYLQAPKDGFLEYLRAISGIGATSHLTS